MKLRKTITEPKTDPAYTDSAIKSQVGGNHYQALGVQPLEATYANFGYIGLRASVHTKVCKYLTRDKGTHKEDITKAIHVLQMQLEFLERSEYECPF